MKWCYDLDTFYNYEHVILNKKILCIGGELNGLEVDFIGPEFRPLSLDNPIDIFKLPAKELSELSEIGPLYVIKNNIGPFNQSTSQYEYIGEHSRF